MPKILLTDLCLVYEKAADISTVLVFFFFKIFLKTSFLCRICVGYIDNLSIYRRSIADIERIFFDFSKKNDFRLQKLCRDGSTPEISTIYRLYFATFSSMLTDKL